MVDAVFQINANATVVQDFVSTVILEDINIIINADASSCTYIRTIVSSGLRYWNTAEKEALYLNCALAGRA